MRLAAIGDIHCNKTSHDILHPLFSQVAQSADILLLCGDLVDYGLLRISPSSTERKKPFVRVLGLIASWHSESPSSRLWLWTSRLRNFLERLTRQLLISAAPC